MGKHGDYPDSWDNLLPIRPPQVHTPEQLPLLAPGKAVSQRVQSATHQPSDKQLASWKEWVETHPVDALCYQVIREIKQLTEFVRTQAEEKLMLPAPQSQANRSSGSSKNRSNKNWLKVEHLTSDKQTAKIIGAEAQHGGYNDVVVKLSLRGTTFFWGLKATNPNFSTLCEAFGRDENEWNGKYIHLFLHWDDFNEQNFVKCEATDSPNKAEGSNKRNK